MISGQLALLISDYLIWSLTLIGGATLILGLRNRLQRERWRMILSRPPAMTAFILLLVYLLIALLDSTHFRPLEITQTADPATSSKQFGTTEISLLDLLLNRIRLTDERSYSAPLALHGYSKEQLVTATGNRRDYPRLKYGGAHITDPANRNRDLLTRGSRGFGIALLILLPVFLLYRLIVRASRLSENNPRIAWTAAFATLAGLVIIGGIKRIGSVAGKLVPLMALSYLAAGIWVLLTHWSAIPDALRLVVNSAFTGHAAGGGFAGATIWMAIRWGVARGVFSNEAGLGSAPIAHAAAKTDNPVRQGTIAMLGTLIDTLVLCSVTGLAILLTGVWDSGETGAPLAAAAFGSALPIGKHVVSIGLAVFAFTTILGWSYYSERCLEYLFGVKVILPFRIVWVLVIPLGALWKLDLVWGVADMLNGLMAIPNLIALVLLSPVVFRLTRKYFSSTTAQTD